MSYSMNSKRSLGQTRPVASRKTFQRKTTLSPSRAFLLLLVLALVGAGNVARSQGHKATLLAEFPEIVQSVSIARCDRASANLLERAGTAEFPIRILGSKGNFLGEIYRVEPRTALILLSDSPTTRPRVYEIPWPLEELGVETRRMVTDRSSEGELVALMEGSKVSFQLRSRSAETTLDLVQVQLQRTLLPEIQQVSPR